MTQAVMVHAAKHDYALPAPLVRQVLELRPEELETAIKELPRDKEVVQLYQKLAGADPLPPR